MDKTIGYLPRLDPTKKNKTKNKNKCTRKWIPRSPVRPSRGSRERSPPGRKTRGYEHRRPCPLSWILLVAFKALEASRFDWFKSHGLISLYPEL